MFNKDGEAKEEKVEKDEEGKEEKVGDDEEKPEKDEQEPEEDASSEVSAESRPNKRIHASMRRSIG